VGPRDWLGVPILGLQQEGPVPNPGSVERSSSSWFAHDRQPVPPSEDKVPRRYQTGAAVTKHSGAWGRHDRMPVERTSSRPRIRASASPSSCFPARASLFPWRQVALNDTKRCSFHRSLLAERSQVYPDCRARIGIEQLGLSGFHARGCEAHDRVSPPVTDDGISNQHCRSTRTSPRGPLTQFR
jgi:hypothetical protein